jgi:hypothetical protein
MLDLKFENKVRKPCVVAAQTKQNIQWQYYFEVAACDEISLSMAVLQSQLLHRTVVLRHLPGGCRINTPSNKVFTFTQKERVSTTPPPHLNCKADGK